MHKQKKHKGMKEYIGMKKIQRHEKIQRHKKYNGMKKYNKSQLFFALAQVVQQCIARKLLAKD